MQGRIVARDLLERGHSVFCADLYKENIGRIIKKYPAHRAFFAYIDLRDIPSTATLIQKAGSDIVINCADMDWNMNVNRACLDTKRHCIDLGSWIDTTDKQLLLDADFKKIKRIAITGCGAVPGIGNVMLRWAARKFDMLDSIDVGYVWGSNTATFVVPFSMKSVLEEFTYNPWQVRNGQWQEMKRLEIFCDRYHRLIGDARSYMVNHPEVTTFEHYFAKSRGLKNIRFFAGFPSHSLAYVQTLIALGFNSDKPIPLRGVDVAPIDMLGPVLKALRAPRGYTENENLWIEIKGNKDRKEKTILMECLVPPIKGWEDTGCNVDTGFPAVIIAKMIKDGTIRERGSFAPEAVVPEKPFFAELAKKKLEVYENGKRIN